jgi:hypothetical protein
MKTTIRSNRAAIAICELAALLCLTFVLTGCKKVAPPSPEKALVTEIAALEREERLLAEGIITAKAGSVMTAQAENLKKAECALALALDRYAVGAGTQIDVVNAQTALLEARVTYVDALRDYAVARGTFIPAAGADLQH